jgi:hypothetical protein
MKKLVPARKINRAASAWEQATPGLQGTSDTSIVKIEFDLGFSSKGRLERTAVVRRRSTAALPNESYLPSLETYHGSKNLLFPEHINPLGS